MLDNLVKLVTENWILFLILGGILSFLFVVTEVSRRAEKKRKETVQPSTKVNEKS